jgi:hypothetical protein
MVVLCTRYERCIVLGKGECVDGVAKVTAVVQMWGGLKAAPC